LARSAAGSLETGMPLLFAPLNWNLGITREKKGATACMKNSKRTFYNQKLKLMQLDVLKA
jgi:hypothetical protein